LPSGLGLIPSRLGNGRIDLRMPPFAFTVLIASMLASNIRYVPLSPPLIASRHGDSLSPLRSGGHPPPRKTRFRLLARLCRAGFVHPQGCYERFPSSSLFLLSRACLTL